MVRTLRLVLGDGGGRQGGAVGSGAATLSGGAR